MQNNVRINANVIINNNNVSKLYGNIKEAFKELYKY